MTTTKIENENMMDKCNRDAGDSRSSRDQLKHKQLQVNLHDITYYATSDNFWTVIHEHLNIHEIYIPKEELEPAFMAFVQDQLDNWRFKTSEALATLVAIDVEHFYILLDLHQECLDTMTTIVCINIHLFLVVDTISFEVDNLVTDYDIGLLALWYSKFMNQIEYQCLDFLGINEASAAIKEATANLRTVLPSSDVYDNLNGNFKEMLSNIDQGSKNGYKLILVSGFTYSIYRAGCNPTIPNVTVLVVVTGYIILNHGSQVTDLLRLLGDKGIELFQKAVKLITNFNKTPSTDMSNDDIQYQGAADWLHLSIDGLAAAITTLLAVDCDKKHLGSVLRINDTLPTFLTKLISIVTRAIDFTFDKNYQSQFGKLSSTNPIMESLDRKIMGLLRDSADGSLRLTSENLDFITELHDECELFSKKIPTTRDFDEMRKTMFQRKSQLWNLEKEFRRHNIRHSGFRQEPVALLLRGGPGAHKSTMLEHFSAAVNAFSLSPEDYEDCKTNPHLYTFNRQFETKFWDGLSNKVNVITFDDFGQAMDIAGDPDNEYMNIIRIINSFEMDVHMAQIEKKGNVKMHAKFVLATTNLKNIAPKSLYSADAIKRRFINTFAVIPKEEYTIDMTASIYERKVDYSRIPKDIHGEPNLLPSCFWFVKMESTLDGQEQVVSQHSFESVVEIMRKQFLQRKQWRDQHIQNFKNTMDEIRTKYDPKEDERLENQSLTLLGSTALQTAGWYLLTTALLKHNATVRYLKTTFGDDSNDYEGDEAEKFKYIQLYSTNVLLRPHLLQEFMIWYNKHEFTQVELDYIEEHLNHVHPGCEVTWFLFSLFVSAGTIDLSPLRGVNTNFNIEIETFIARVDILPKHVLYNSPDMEIVSLSTVIKDILKTMFVTAHEVLEFLWDNKGKIVALVGSIYVGIPFIQKMLGYDDETEIEDQMVYDNPGRQHHQQQQKATLKSLRDNALIHQGTDVQAYEIASSVLNRNLAILQASYGDVEVELGYVLIIAQNLVIFPSHYIHNLGKLVGMNQRDMQIELLDSNRCRYGVATFEEFLASSDEDLLKDSDLIVSKFTNMRPVRDITNKFITESEVKRLPCVFTTSIHFLETNGRKSRTVVSANSRLETVTTSEVTVNKAVRYYADTFKGDCGTPLFFREKGAASGKILGLHTAGSSREGAMTAYSTLVTKEQLEQAKSIFSNSIQDDFELEPLEVQAPSFIEEKYNILGKSEHIHSPYGRNSLIPSALQSNGGYESTKLPAMVLPRSGKDPYKIALQKYCLHGAVLENPVLRLATHDLDKFMFTYVKESERRVLDLSTAIWGDDGEALQSIKLRTSPGYPIRWTKPKLKQELFGDTAIRGVDNPSYEYVRLEVERVVKAARNGRRMLWVFTDNLKVELRSAVKARSGSTRLFNGAPLIYFIVVRMYFGSFMSFMYDRSLNNLSGCSLAINERSNDWHLLAKRLSRFDVGKDPLVGAGDFSGFDGSEMPIVHNIILDCINRWYDDGPVNASIRKVLWAEVINSRHLVDGIIYEWHSSLPSGHPLTIIINCLYNHFAFRYCWYLIPQCQEHNFAQYVQLEVTGDDNIFAVSDRFKCHFNEITLSKLMNKVGLVYTTELKGVAEVPFRKLSEVSYLKRNFRWEPTVNEFVGSISLDSIDNMICWNQNTSIQQNFKERVEVYSKELALHSEDVFNRRMKKLRISIQLLFPDIAPDLDIYRSREQYLKECYPELELLF